MAIIGIGTDIVEVARIEQTLLRNTRFAERILTPKEYKKFTGHTQPARYLAKRFAAKEAAAKALQTGIGRGVSWHHLEVDNDTNGAPYIVLCDGALKVFEQKGGRTCHLSISDEKHFAVATVILEN